MPPKTPRHQPEAGAQQSAGGTALARRLTLMRDEAAMSNAGLAARLGTTEGRVADLFSGAATPTAGELAGIATCLLARTSSSQPTDDDGAMASLTDVANRYSTREGHEPASTIAQTMTDGRGADANSRYGEDLQMTRLFSLIEADEDRAFLIALAGLMTQR